MSSESRTPEQIAAEWSNETMVAALLSLHYRLLDAGGMSSRRSHYSTLTEPALALMRRYRPAGDIQTWPPENVIVREAERRERDVNALDREALLRSSPPPSWRESIRAEIEKLLYDEDGDCVFCVGSPHRRLDHEAACRGTQILARLAAQPAESECHCECVNCVAGNHGDCYYLPGACPFKAQPETPIPTAQEMWARTNRPLGEAQPAPKDDRAQLQRWRDLICEQIANTCAHRLDEVLAELGGALASPPPPKENNNT